MKDPVIISPKPSRITFAQFCFLHNLPIHVHERDLETRAWGKVHSGLVASYRYYAIIPYLEVAKDEILYSSICGNGNTVQSAIKDLARKMSNQEVRVDHRFIRVPKLKV